MCLIFQFIFFFSGSSPLKIKNRIGSKCKGSYLEFSAHFLTVIKNLSVIHFYMISFLVNRVCGPAISGSVAVKKNTRSDDDDCHQDQCHGFLCRTLQL